MESRREGAHELALRCSCPGGNPGNPQPAAYDRPVAVSGRMDESVRRWPVEEPEKHIFSSPSSQPRRPCHRHRHNQAAQAVAASRRFPPRRYHHSLALRARSCAVAPPCRGCGSGLVGYGGGIGDAIALLSSQACCSRPAAAPSRWPAEGCGLWHGVCGRGRVWIHGAPRPVGQYTNASYILGGPQRYVSESECLFCYR